MKKGALSPFCILMIILVSSSIFPDPSLNASTDPIAHLILSTNEVGSRPDVCLFIAQQLFKIGINVDVRIQEWIDFWGTLYSGGIAEYDMGYMTLYGVTGDPDPSNCYFEKAEEFNWMGEYTEMPYIEESNNLILQGSTTLDLIQRHQIYYDWQELYMDKIIQVLPFYVHKNYHVTWSTLQGYDQRWGIANCLPYMEFSELHEGQESLTEFIDFGKNWRNLNPLFMIDKESQKISDLIIENLLELSPDGDPIKMGLTTDWVISSDNLISFRIREDTFWNPSYNITENDGSNPIETLPLAIGLKGENSTGINQHVTAKDAVFTLCCHANPIINERASLYSWIKNVWVDENDKQVFHLLIDGNPNTLELEPYAPVWSLLNVPLMPEFFLNSTTSTVTQTISGMNMTGFDENTVESDVWKFYSYSAFGCGKYMLEFWNRNYETVLKASPYWHGEGIIDGTAQDLDIDTFIMRVIPDKTSDIAEFKAGKLDILRTKYKSQIEFVWEDSRFEMHISQDDKMDVLYFNIRRPFVGGDFNYEYLEAEGKTNYTKGVAIRKAICYAIDREEINQMLFDGGSLISNSPVIPIQYYYTDFPIKYSHNLTKAAEWLIAAGFEILPTTTTETTTETTPTSSETTFSTIETSESSTIGTRGQNAIMAIFSLIILINVIIRRRGNEKKK